MRNQAERLKSEAKRAVNTARAIQARLSGDYGQLPGLSPRETQVLRLLSLGLSAKEIASMLEISGNTVNYHTSAVYRKLGAHSRVRAVNAYRELLRGGVVDAQLPQR